VEQSPHMSSSSSQHEPTQSLRRPPAQLP
jgi:hypothetical protein